MLPGGVVAHVPPPAEKRIVVGGKFLDEVRIRQGRSSFLSFPVNQHRGAVGDDGVATIYAKMPTVVALFAEGLLSPVGGPPTEVIVGRKRLGPMVLKEVACLAEGGHNDVALLVFHPVPVAVDA